MYNKKTDTDFDKLRNFVLSLYDEDRRKIELVVSEEEQQEEIDLLKRTMETDARFFFMVDLLNFQLKSAPFNLSRWLQWPESEFSLKFYFNHIVHPSRRPALFLTAEQLYSHLCRGFYPLKFMVQRYSTLLPLRHQDGHYVLAKKTSSVFQFDTKKRLISYLNEFTITNFEPDSKELESGSLTPTLYNANGQKEESIQRQIMAKVIQRFLDMGIFSAKQLQIARLLAYNKDHTKEHIAKVLNKRVDAVDWHYRQFLNNARRYFDINFATALDAATHLRKEGLL